MKSAHLCMYAIGLFACNDKLSFQVGFIITITDVNDRCHFLNYRNAEPKRIVQSIMADKPYVFGEAFDAAFVVTKYSQPVHEMKFQLNMLTDSKHVFRCRYKSAKKN